MATKLFTPARVGATTVNHRLVLPPMTRLRASLQGVPNDLIAQYYEQRSNGGLLITEGTFVAEEAGGFKYAPGIYSPEQIAAWKRVTKAVHAAGGFIFVQLWALGRVADPSLVDTVWSPGTVPFVPPGSKKPPTKITPLSEADIQRFVGRYSTAAKNAIEAGFDGIEIHGANGYLIDQFLQSKSNNRTDSYGGSLENRFRFPLQVLDAVAAAIGPERVGIRLSPYAHLNGLGEEDPLSVFVVKGSGFA